MTIAQRALAGIFAGMGLLVVSAQATAAPQYTVDLLPGFVYASQTDAEAALHAYSAEASHLIRERLLSETPTVKVWLYSAPPQPLQPPLSTVYGAPYYLHTSYWIAPAMQTVEGAISDWWSRYQAYWTWAFPGCSYTTTYYPTGESTNVFARVDLAGTCGGAGAVTGTLIQAPTPAQCPPDYVNTGSQCEITLTALMTEAGVEVCPVAPLSPITDPEVQRFEANPDTSDTDRLNDRMKRALSCLQQAIGDAGGMSSVGSAYRPPAYNQHLLDVWKKWDELRDETNPSCQALRAEARAHFQRHKLLESQPPVPNSPHTRGEAFDLTSNLPNATLDTLARGCRVYRNLPIRDRVHFIHR